MDKFGLAVGGLGGFNAHDAGVLTAAADCGFQPDAITCTSGAIFWVAHFVDPDPKKTSMRAAIEETIRERRPSQIPMRLLFGNKVARPAYAEYLAGLPKDTAELFAAWFEGMASFTRTALGKPGADGLNDAAYAAMSRVGAEWLDFLMPAHVATSVITDETFQWMLAVINGHPRPILLNATNVTTGQEIVFYNPATLDDTVGLPYVKRRVDRYGTQPPVNHLERAYVPLGTDINHLRQALWVSFYGFEQNFGDKAAGTAPRARRETIIDGGYRRQIILTELCNCNKIFVVKPQSFGYRDAPPENYWEVQDFNTEMWFNASYAAEVAGINLINDLMADGRLSGPTEKDSKSYHMKTVIPIEIDKPLGFSNYLRERMEVFDDGYERAKSLFAIRNDDEAIRCYLAHAMQPEPA